MLINIFVLIIQHIIMNILNTLLALPFGVNADALGMPSNTRQIMTV